MQVMTCTACSWTTPSPTPAASTRQVIHSIITVSFRRLAPDTIGNHMFHETTNQRTPAFMHGEYDDDYKTATPSCSRKAQPHASDTSISRASRVELKGKLMS